MSDTPPTPAHDSDLGDVVAYQTPYLWSAMMIHLGEYMAMIIASFIVFHRTHSVVKTGLILVVFNLPALLLASPATSLTQRFGAARVDAWVNLVEALVALVPMALGFHHQLTLGAVYGWVGVYGVCEGLNTPNSFLVRQILASPGRLPELNSAYTRNVAAAAALGTLCGGALYTWAGSGWVFLVCALSAGPEIVVLFRLAAAMARRTHPVAPTDSLREALQLLRTEPGLWAAVRFAVLCFFVAGYAVTLPAIANRLGGGAVSLALLESGSLLGGILVAVVVKRVHGRVSWGRMQRWRYFAAGIALAAMSTVEFVSGHHSLAPNVMLVAITIPISFTVLMNASIVTSVIQIATPQDQRASMFTLVALIPLVVGPLSQEIVGALADSWSVAGALGVVAAVTLVVNVVTSHRPMAQHFDALDRADAPFAVNELGGHRGGHRVAHHPRHLAEHRGAHRPELA